MRSCADPPSVSDRLGVVTRALFSQKDFSDTSILDDFHSSLEPSLRGQMTESGLYMGETGTRMTCSTMFSDQLVCRNKFAGIGTQLPSTNARTGESAYVAEEGKKPHRRVSRILLRSCQSADNVLWPPSRALMYLSVLLGHAHPWYDHRQFYVSVILTSMPGLLHNLDDSGSPPLAYRAQTLQRPNSLKTSDPKSMLAYMGLPLDLFGKVCAYI